MLFLKSSPRSSLQPEKIIERALQALLAFVIFAVSYRYCWKDITDPFKCGALLNQGEWLDPGSRWTKPAPYQTWQAPGCMMHEYNRKDIEACFYKKRIVLIGDSTIRQIYWAVAKKMDQQRTQNDMTQLLESDEKHLDHEFNAAEVTVQFKWDPWLNSTALDHELKSFKPSPSDDAAESDQSAAVVLLGAPGLWYARHGEENYFKDFRNTVDKIIPYMDHEPEDEDVSSIAKTFPNRKQSPNFLLLAPVQVPAYELLSPSREQTITPQKIDQMNDYLQQVSAYSKADIVWSYSLMAHGESKSQYEESGLHVANNVARGKADVLLNLRCNFDTASSSYPYDRSCCSNYKQAGGAQWIILIAGVIVLPILFLGGKMQLSQFDRYVPSSYDIKPPMVVLLVLCFCFCTDRSQLFEKAQKHFQQSEFATLCTTVGFLGLLTIRRSQPQKVNSYPRNRGEDLGLLSRDQTDEWKGWMQAFILIYHYTHGSQSLEIYEIVRLLVASYLFMTGYGHAMWFLRNDEYSLIRAASILIRLNILTAGLTFMMGTDYLFYYFPPLVSFWFSVIFLVLKLGRSRNSNPYFVIGKIIFAATLSTVFIIIPGPLNLLASVLKYIFRVSWDIEEWRFRLFLDMYIVYFGMIFAVSHHRSSLLQSNTGTPVRYIDRVLYLTVTYNRIFKFVITFAAFTFLPGFWALTRRSPDKEDYNWWIPYISFIPILCFIVIRNNHRLLRNYHSAAFAWLGRISLETYILQYHIWLAGDTKGLLRLGLWNRGIEATILTSIFLWLGWVTAGATRRLTAWIVMGKSLHSLHNDLAEPSTILPQNSSDRLRRSIGSDNGEKEIAGGSPHGWLAKGAEALRKDLRLRIGLIFALIWLGNVTYQ